MKNIIIIALFFIGMFSLCTSQVKESSSIKEGWVDDDTFRAMAVGKSAPNDPSGLKACMAGVIVAQSVLIEKLADAGVESVKGKISVKYKPSFSKEISGTVKSPRIVSQKYYSERKECEVIVEIKEKDLKKKVMETAQKVAKP